MRGLNDRRRRLAGHAAAIGVLVSLGGCSTLPSSGPTANDVLAASRSTARLPATLVDLTAETLSTANAPETSTETLAGLAATGEIDLIGPGDILQVTVFEVGTTLFSGGSALAATAGQPTAAGSGLPLMTVARDGTITIPYVGQLRVAGQTPQEVEQAVLQGMRGLSQYAQVSVSVRESVTNSAFVLGGVRTPGRVRLSAAREHVLDAIALAGGTTTKPQDTTVRVTRGERSAEIAMDALRAGSPEDLMLLPGDRIEILSAVQSFTVFGATDRVSEIPFEMRRLTLAQAVARAGGPSDRQADPTAVFVFRWAPQLEGGTAPGPIIYRLNMLQPESYFVAQRFAMRNGDVIYIANARSNQATKLVQIINQLFSPFYGVRELTR
jgi:polysaccharide export outer membrane protein